MERVDRERVGGEGAEAQAALLAQMQNWLAESAAPGEGAPLELRLWTPLEGLALLAMSGEMDMSNAHELPATLAPLLRQQAQRVIVDLSQMSFIDSTGIRAVVTVTNGARESGGEVVLAAPSENVARTFEIVKLRDFVPIVDSVAAALGVLGPRADDPRLQ